MFYLIYRNNNKGQKDCLFMIKIGVWYVTYDEDADILNHLFGYKMVYFKSYRKVSFPESRINFVENMLKRNNINYQIYIRDSLFITFCCPNNHYYFYKMQMKEFQNTKKLTIGSIIKQLEQKSLKELEKIYTQLGIK